MNNKSGTTALREYGDARRNVTPMPFAIPARRRAMVLVLDELIVRDGRTQLAIAVASHVDQSWLSRVRRGKENPTRGMYTALADGMKLGAYDRARLLCSAGFLPIEDDPVFIETVCQIAARRGLTRNTEAASM